MKLCQWLIELRNTSNATSFYPKAVMTSLFFSSGANQVVGEGNAKKRLTPMIDRLRDMARESKDAGLNIHWMNMDITQILLTGRVEHEIYDQEVAMALFLNRCDSFATTRSAAGVGMFGMSERFSKSHYAMGLLDLRQRLRPYYVTANASSTNRTRMPVILLQRSAQDNDAMKEAGFMSPKTSSDSASVSSAGTKPPHFDVVRISPQGQYYEELFSIDASREDVFESMIVFMLMIYLSSQESAEDDEQEEEEEEERKKDLSTLAGSFDYRVIKPILEEIIGKDELQVMMDQVSLPAAFSANSGASTNASIYGSTGKTASPNPRHPISPHLNHSRLSSSSFSSATKPTVGEGMGSSSKFNFTSSSLPTHHHNKAATPSTTWSSAKKIPLHSNMFGGNTTAAGATPSSGLKSAQRNTSHLDQSYHQGNMSRFYSSVGSPQ